MRHIWKEDEEVFDLFPSTTIGWLWLGDDMPDIMDESRAQAGAILGLTVQQIRELEYEQIRNNFFGKAS